MKKLSIILITMLLFSACAQQGPLSPRQTLSALKKAYEQKDGTLFLSLITHRSRQTLETNTEIFNELSTETKAEIYSNAKVGFDAATPLRVEDYVTLYFACNHEIEKDLVAKALESKITAVDESENSVIYTMANGLELRFERVDPYWKFDYAAIYE